MARGDDEGYFVVNPLVHQRKKQDLIYCRVSFISVYSPPHPASKRCVEYRISFQEKDDYLSGLNNFRQYRIRSAMRNIDTFFMEIPNYLYTVEGLEEHIINHFINTVLIAHQYESRRAVMNRVFNRQKRGKFWLVYGHDPMQDGPIKLTSIQHIEVFEPLTSTAPVTHSTSRIEYRVEFGPVRSVGGAFTDGNQWVDNLANTILSPDTLRKLTSGFKRYSSSRT